jgi:hypothetical protein
MNETSSRKPFTDSKRIIGIVGKEEDSRLSLKLLRKHIDLLQSHRAIIMRGMGWIDFQVKDLEELLESENPDVANIAKKLVTLAYEEIQNGTRNLGLKANLKPSIMRYYRQTGTVSVQWTVASSRIDSNYSIISKLHEIVGYTKEHFIVRGKT